MKESTKEFLELAEDDLRISKEIYRIKEYRASCFYSQQATEKFLKAFLVEKNVFDPKKHRTHNLLLLLNECIKIDKDFEELRKYNIGRISAYIVITRYDISSLKNITQEDAKEAIEIAEKVREFVLKKLSSDFR